MGRGISLHVGLEGAEGDACAMTDLAAELGYETTTLLGERARSGEVPRLVGDAALCLDAGDAFMFSVAPGEAPPPGWARDVGDLWSTFRAGVGVLVMAEPALAPDPAPCGPATVITLAAPGGDHLVAAAVAARLLAATSGPVTSGWEQVAGVLADRLAPTTAADGDLLSRAVVESARASTLEPLRSPSGPPAFRGFWWGFHVEVGSCDLAGSHGRGALVRALRAVVPMEHARWIEPVARVAAANRALDLGRGVRISMSWHAPGVFVPGPV